MANITRIKATDPNKSKEKDRPKDKPKEKPKKLKEKPKKPALKEAEVVEKKAKKPFILFRPFVALGRYLKGSWLELRQVRWPSRKATWKMVLAVLVYTFIFGAFLLLLDVLFDLIFNKLLG